MTFPVLRPAYTVNVLVEEASGPCQNIAQEHVRSTELMMVALNSTSRSHFPHADKHITNGPETSPDNDEETNKQHD
jgi:hypothetical protein